MGSFYHSWKGFGFPYCISECCILHFSPDCCGVMKNSLAAVATSTLKQNWLLFACM